ncbi:pyridoxamine 5'-phosphate oxidase [Gordonia sp. X0973]|uniref:pyridoxamine 5'-phosphate oxidase n=1 Tax=Gordonia sp. X0973 TaxID=2742602 RepID=UPI000F52BDDA|nr:pyridoxamine 5'-phosphate oxidase [Gordonia sp. X0973]QKT06384.1 pyridoxamine 5'-phosphate oxidase [Gordonia sp. X0973]
MEPRTEHPIDVAGMRVGYGSLAGVGTGDAATSGADGVAEHLDSTWLTGDPPWLGLFERWLGEAIAARIPEPNAMVVGTVGADGRPATRTVLCKGFSAAGITFFTGYSSAKGEALAAHPFAALTFPWIALERQVHLRGAVTKADAQTTRAYWESRPRGSQISAYASAQSRPIAGRAELEELAARTAQRFGGLDGDEPIPVPPEWGGYLVDVDYAEFWQGRADRLHNRVRAVRTDDGWDVDRLQP